MPARQQLYTRRARLRLGSLLMERRPELDPLYEERKVFAAARSIDLRLVQDIENVPEGRGESTAKTLIEKIAPAYGIAADSIFDVLGEVPGSDLVAAQSSPPRRPRGRHRATGPAAGPLVPLLSPGREDRARPYADRISEDRRRWQLAYAAAHPGIPADDVPEPPGPDLFPSSALDAAAWDENAGVLTPSERVWLVAELQALRAAARERRAGTG